MVSKSILALVEEIAADSTSGASDLALRAVDVFIAYCETSRLDDRSRCMKELEMLSSLLQRAQPSMASVRNAACLSLELWKCVESQSYVPWLKRMRESIASARRKVALEALSVIPKRSTIVTNSFSANVLEALILAHGKGSLKKVLVSESRPLMEGRRTAAKLAQQGIQCELIIDAAAPFVAKECDLALVGADSILKDGAVVNKVGTFPLAMACREADIPFYSASELIKVDLEHDFENPPEIAERDPKEILDFENSHGIKAKNIYFDTTPPKYITSIVTEVGKIKPSSLRRKVGDLDALLQVYHH